MFKVIRLSGGFERENKNLTKKHLKNNQIKVLSWENSAGKENHKGSERFPVPHGGPEQVTVPPPCPKPKLLLAYLSLLPNKPPCARHWVAAEGLGAWVAQVAES